MPRLKPWVKFFRPAPLKIRAQKTLNRIKAIISGRPLTAFFAVLLLLLVLIAAAHQLNKRKSNEEVKQNEPKKVSVYTIGKLPSIKVSAQVQKDGVIQITAQTPGIVQKVSVSEGDKVWRGKNLVSLSTNYQGANTASLSRQLAETQLLNINETYDKQKDIISKQREIANKNSESTDKLRSISTDSLNDTNSLLKLNQDIVNTLNSNLKNLEDTNAGGANDQLILATKQQISSFQAAANQLAAASRSLSYTTDTDKPPTQIADITKEITTEQLDIQEKALELSKRVSQIQLNLARAAEATMFPVSPVTGVVQKVFVHIGQSVSPGMPLVTIASTNGSVSAIAKVPKSIADSVSIIDTSTILIGNEILQTLPRFISTEATDSQLYSIIYDIPQNIQSDLTNMEYVNIEIPIGHSDSNSVVPFIPIDSVFQTQDTSFVYVIKDQKAEAKEVTLGNVLGGDVEVKSGITDGDQIILNRNIIAGDVVTTNK